MTRRLPPMLVVLTLLCTLASACAPSLAVGRAAVTSAAGDVAASDPGEAARAAILARYADGTPTRTATTPSILGRTPAAAEALLQDAGLDIHLVAFDRRRPVTVQWPPAGQPVPLDGVIEAWLGRPPLEEDPVPATAEVAPASATASAPASATAEPEAPSPEASGQAPSVAGGVTHVLPPHTEGMLRINPRRLPALPLGTQLVGRASWYGPGFHGLTTACGGTFDRNGPTLASRELRCGTVVRITGPSGLTVEATVTDWGPAEWTNRRFDLSEAVFNAIAPLGAGVIDVSVVTANVPG